MSATARTRRLQIEEAERRVVEQLKVSTPASSPRRRAAVVAIVAVLFGASFAARLAVNDPDALLANFYVVPVTVLAIEFGTRAGLVGAAISIVLAPWVARPTSTACSR